MSYSPPATRYKAFPRKGYFQELENFFLQIFNFILPNPYPIKNTKITLAANSGNSLSWQAFDVMCGPWAKTARSDVQNMVGFSPTDQEKLLLFDDPVLLAEFNDMEREFSFFQVIAKAF